MNCPRCGAMNDPNAPQCIYCGNPLAAAPPPQQYGAPPPAYGAPPPGYGAPPPGYGMEQPMVSTASRTSGMAIGGFICSFLCGLLGLILSIIAVNQINKSMGMLRGKGLAMAGIIISILNMLAGVSMQVCGRSSYRRSYRSYRYGQLEQKKHQQPMTARAVDQAQLQRMAAASAAVRL